MEHENKTVQYKYDTVSTAVTVLYCSFANFPPQVGYPPQAKSKLFFPPLKTSLPLRKTNSLSL